jgi:hypothetical protein
LATLWRIKPRRMEELSVKMFLTQPVELTAAWELAAGNVPAVQRALV